MRMVKVLQHRFKLYYLVMFHKVSMDYLVGRSNTKKYNKKIIIKINL